MSYIVAQPDGCKKPLLLRVTGTKGNASKCVVPDDTKYTSPQVFTVRPSQIVCTLGDEPAYGTAYGVLVEPIMSRRIAPKWGEVYSYAKLTDQMNERLDKALRITLAKLGEMGLTAWHPVKTEVRNPKGKILGTYHYKSAGEDLLTLRPPEGMSSRELISLIGHECGGHGVWNRIMTCEQRAQWLAYYQQYVAVKMVPQKDVLRMVKEMRQLQSLRDYMKECEPEELASVHIYVAWLQKVHNLSKRDVQDMIGAGVKPPVPDTHLHKSEVATPLTLYSKTNAEELFSEAMGLYLIDALTNKTLKKMILELKG